MRMRLTVLFLLGVTVVPMEGRAQRSRATAPGSGESGAGMPAMRAPNMRDIDELNPAWLMLDKKKKLSLTDSQVAQFKALQAKLIERNKQLLADYDSVRRDFHPPAGSIARAKPKQEADVPTANDRDVEKARSQLRVLNYVISQLAERRKADVDETIALFTDEAQKKKALDFLKDQDEDLAKMLPRGGPPGGQR